MNHVQKFYIQGFAMVVSPGRVADCDIFFRAIGHSPNIVGIDLYDKEKNYLGFVYPQNVDLAVKRAMRAYIMAHKKKWQRIHSDDDLQKIRSK